MHRGQAGVGSSEMTPSQGSREGANLTVISEHVNTTNQAAILQRASSIVMVTYTVSYCVG